MWGLSRAAGLGANNDMRSTGTLALGVAAHIAEMAALPISLAHVVAGSVGLGAGIVSLDDSAGCARDLKNALSIE